MVTTIPYSRKGRERKVYEAAPIIKSTVASVHHHPFPMDTVTVSSLSEKRKVTMARRLFLSDQRGSVVVVITRLNALACRFSPSGKKGR